MIDAITATIAAFVGFAALVGLMLWAESQRGRVVRGESCVCTPSRGMGLTQASTYSVVDARRDYTRMSQVDTEAIDIMLERHRHEMSEAIERERHYQRLQRIHEQRTAPQPQLPQPVRRTVPRLPAPSVVEIPGETVTTDGYRWVALEREVSGVSE